MATGTAILLKAFDYILSCRPSWYAEWWDGPLSDRSPSWAVNLPPPPPEEVNEEGLFCAAVPNLMLRVADVTIPYRPSFPSEDWDGGTLAYYEYYYDNSEWFSLDEDYPDGTLLISPFNGAGAQGHVAVVLEGYCVESIHNGGLVWAYTVAESNAWGKYELAVHPDRWINVTPRTPRPEDPDPPDPPQGATLNAKMLAQIIRAANSETYPESYMDWLEDQVPSLIASMRQFEINTKWRAACFLGNNIHETDYMRTFEEYGDEAYFRSFLGDMWWWHGRGGTMLTWPGNYEAAGEFFGESFTGNDGWDAEKVATLEWAWPVSGWFWRNWAVLNGERVDLNDYADAEDFDSTVVGINGGWTHYNVRLAIFNAAMAVLPDDFNLGDDTPVPDPDKPIPEPPEEGIVQPARYNFIASKHDMASVVFAHALDGALAPYEDSSGLAIVDPDNARRVGDAAVATNDIGVLNTITVGPGSHDLLSEEAQAWDGWENDNPIWQTWNPDDTSPLGTLRRCKWAVYWIAKYEGLDEDELCSTFYRVVVALNSEYKTIVDKVKKENGTTDNPDPIPDPPPEQSLEEQVADHERRIRKLEANVG